MKFTEITDAELKVMKIIWDQSPLILADIVAALKNRLDWSPKTIQTLVGRLVKKKFVGAKPDGPRRNAYYPLIKEDNYKQHITQSFMSQIYNGKLSVLVSSMLKNESLAPEEIKELKRILEESEQ